MRRIARLAIVMLLLVWSSATSAEVTKASTPADDDIPGTPLVEGNIQGVAGGIIVDQVYSYQVAQKGVLVVSVSAESGAELGLYLFSSEATSILIDAPLAQSAKPGGQQTVVQAIFSPSDIYINVNGRNTDRPYRYTLNVTLIVDTSAPILREVRVPSTAKTGNVCAFIYATDPTSNVSEVSIGESTSEDTWTPYRGATNYCAPLLPGTTNRTIFVAAKNGVGLISRRAFKIVVDDLAPQVMSTEPIDELMLSPFARLKWTFDEPIFPTLSDSIIAKVTTPSGELLDGITRLSPNRTSVFWTPKLPIRAGSVILATLVSVSDAAGNERPTDLTRIVYRKNATALRLTLLERRRSKAIIRLEVSSNLLGRTIVFEGWNGNSWLTLFPVSLSSRRSVYSIGLTTMKIRATYPGNERQASSVSKILNFSK